MFEAKISGKFTLEYLIYLFRCLQKHGSVGDRIAFSQNSIQKIEIHYDSELTGSFRILILKPLSTLQLDKIIKTHSLVKVENPNEELFKHTLRADSPVDVAHCMLFGSNTLLNSEDEFELDFEFAKDVFVRTSSKAQVIHPPLLNLLFVLVWQGYEFLRYKVDADRLSFDIGHIDAIEVGLFLVSGWIFWVHKVTKEKISVFREGTCSSFERNKAWTRGLITSTVFLAVFSTFTS